MFRIFFLCSWNETAFPCEDKGYERWRSFPLHCSFPTGPWQQQKLWMGSVCFCTRRPGTATRGNCNRGGRRAMESTPSLRASCTGTQTTLWIQIVGENVFACVAFSCYVSVCCAHLCVVCSKSVVFCACLAYR